MPAIPRLAAGLAAASLGLLFAHAAQAAPADDARAHFQAIAAGDVSAVMAQYADQAQFQWVGGALDGLYAGAEPIRALWTKFAAAQGALKLSVGTLEESANPKGATVTANVMFEGKAPLKVRYVLVYREGRIVSETWQVDPKLALGAGY